MAQMKTDPPDITNNCEERNRLWLEIEALDIVINRCTELVNFPDTDDNHEMKAILRASIDDTQRKKDTMTVFPKKTARPVSPLPSEPVTVNKSFSDLESKNDKDQVAPEENNETAPPKPKPPPPIHLKIKKNIRDQLKSIYQKFPDITNKSTIFEAHSHHPIKATHEKSCACYPIGSCHQFPRPPSPAKEQNQADSKTR
ncbi:uncharacterized protein TNCV_2945731 [Trichonephila clavipes]|nr:uncharacterized protein TNCV_2945731 [Trichonephila clavipes]